MRKEHEEGRTYPSLSESISRGKSEPIRVGVKRHDRFFDSLPGDKERDRPIWVP